MPHIPMVKERNLRTGFFEREQMERVLDHVPAAVRPALSECDRVEAAKKLNDLIS